MLVFHVLFICQSIIASVSSSIDSDSESLMSCSKFHFEEKILEKLVRLEHKMEINEGKMKKLDNTFGSKLDKFDEAIKQTENKALKQIENTLKQEQKRFNQSLGLISEDFRITSNKTVQELIEKQQKGYDALLKKRQIVAFSAYRKNMQTLSRSDENFKFDNVWTNIGNGYDPSTGIFTAPYPGVYHFTAVAVSLHDNTLYLKLFHNNNSTSGSWVTGSGYKTGTLDVVLKIQKGDKVYVGAAGDYALYSDRGNYSTFSGYLIA